MGQVMVSTSETIQAILAVVFSHLFITDVLASEGVARQQPRVLAQLLNHDAEEVRSAALWHLNVHLHDVLSLWQLSRDSPFDS
jgi:hypothetical protein